MRIASELALTELLLSGCTTTADHHYVFPEVWENAVDMQVDAAKQVGMRMTISRGSMNLSKKGWRPATRRRERWKTPSWRQRARVESVVTTSARRARTVGAGTMLCRFLSTGTLMRRTAELAKRFDWCIAHASAENARSRTTTVRRTDGCRPVVAFPEETGWLRTRTWLAHGIHFIR